jgi:hypothetical protein
MSAWKAVVGFAGLYEVSDSGCVRTIGRGPGRVEGRIHKECINSRGYPVVSLRTRDRVHVQRYVHDLVTHAFHGTCPRGYQVNHKDCDKTNNRLSNLEYVTPQENNAHEDLMGLRPRGENNGRAILTDGHVKEIRSLHKSGISYSRIAARFFVSKSCIAHIASGRQWKHLL